MVSESTASLASIAAAMLAVASGSGTPGSRNAASRYHSTVAQHLAKHGGKGYTVTVDPSTSYGVWEGWGTSLCWWANVFGDDDALADLTFSLNATPIDGLGALPGPGSDDLALARFHILDNIREVCDVHHAA